MKILKDCGVNGTSFEHGAGVEAGYNFAELQTWLFLKLFQNPDQDAEKLVIEFTDYYYGKAAPMIRAYIKDLEELRKKMPINLSWNPTFTMFTFLTVDRIMKWENDFDAMEKMMESSPGQLRHIRMCRVSLDIAMLHKWHDLKKRYPDIAITPKEIYSRIMANFEAEAKIRFPENSIRTYWRNNLEKTVSQVLFQAEVKPKPLSGFFSKFPPENIRQAFPVNGLVKDKDAACGSAAAADFEQLPLGFGLYDNYNAKFNISNKIQSGDIKPDHYEIYKLGQAELTPQCLVWFTEGWVVTVPIEQFYVVGEPFIKWDIYASLKFEGPKFGSADKNKKNRVFCDRIILVRAENQEGNK